MTVQECLGSAGSAQVRTVCLDGFDGHVTIWFRKPGSNSSVSVEYVMINLDRDVHIYVVDDNTLQFTGRVNPDAVPRVRTPHPHKISIGGVTISGEGISIGGHSMSFSAFDGALSVLDEYAMKLLRLLGTRVVILVDPDVEIYKNGALVTVPAE